MAMVEESTPAVTDNDDSMLTFHRYQCYVKACIAGDAVPGDITPEHVDHRFFHEENQVGYCICGAVRKAATKELAQLGTYCSLLTIASKQ